MNEILPEPTLSECRKVAAERNPRMVTYAYHQHLIEWLIGQVDFFSGKLSEIYSESDARICPHCKSSRQLLGLSEPLYKAVEDIKAGEEVCLTKDGIRLERTFRAEMKAKFEVRYSG